MSRLPKTAPVQILTTSLEIDECNKKEQEREKRKVGSWSQRMKAAVIGLHPIIQTLESYMQLKKPLFIHVSKCLERKSQSPGEGRQSLSLALITCRYALAQVEIFYEFLRIFECNLSHFHNGCIEGVCAHDLGGIDSVQERTS